MNDVRRENLIRIISKRTKKWAEEYYPEKEEVSEEYSEKALKLHGIILRGSFGCVTDSVTELISELTGEKIPPVDRDNEDCTEVDLDRLVMVVPLGNDNSHNYELKKPVLAYSNSTHCFRVDGNMGNSITETKNLLRPATEEEIRYFVENYKGDFEEDFDITFVD